ncbi:hypothetical protein D3C72_1589070 [compost metagenome]
MCIREIARRAGIGQNRTFAHAAQFANTLRSPRANNRPFFAPERFGHKQTLNMGQVSNESHPLGLHQNFLRSAKTSSHATTFSECLAGCPHRQLRHLWRSGTRPGPNDAQGAARRGAALRDCRQRGMGRARSGFRPRLPSLHCFAAVLCEAAAAALPRAVCDRRRLRFPDRPAVGAPPER